MSGASVRRQNTCCLNVQGWKGRERRGSQGVKKEEEEGGRGGGKDKISPAFSSSAMSCLDCLPLAAALSPLSGPEGRSPITGKSAAANEVSLNQRVQSQGGEAGNSGRVPAYPLKNRQTQSTTSSLSTHKKTPPPPQSLHKSSRPVFSHLALSDTGVRVSSAHFKAL